MKILVINAGSSSVKYQVFDMNDESVLAKGICEQIGDEMGSFTYKVPATDYKYEEKIKMLNFLV
jgi:acetate kinase